MTAKIYVAAASRDLERYRAFVERALRNPHCLQLTYDWSEMILEAQRKGLTDSTIDDSFAARAAFADAAGVRDCSVLVLLAPRPGQITIGAWSELGIALGLRIARPTRKPLIIVSSSAKATRQYAIFEELADVCVDSDDEALVAAARLTRSMELEDQQGIDLDDLAAMVGVVDGGST